jgi:hypothetical protein
MWIKGRQNARREDKNNKVRDHLEDLDVNGKIKLKWILER